MMNDVDNEALEQIIRIAEEIYTPYNLTANCQVIQSKTGIVTFYVYVRLYGMDVILLRSMTENEMLIKISLMRDCLSQQSFKNDDMLLHRMAQHMLVQAKESPELAVIAFELDCNYRMYLEVLSRKNQSQQSTQH